MPEHMDNEQTTVDPEAPDDEQTDEAPAEPATPEAGEPEDDEVQEEAGVIGDVEPELCDPEAGTWPLKVPLHIPPELVEFTAHDIERAANLNERQGRAWLAWKKCRVMESVGEIEQTGYNEHHRYPYSTEDDYYNAIRPAMSAAGLAFSINIKDRLREIHGESSSGNERICTTLVIEFTLTCALTGAQEVSTWTAEAYDGEGKGIPKAVIQASKYFLAKTFLGSSAPGDDSDAGGRRKNSRSSKRSSGGSRPAGQSARQKLSSALEAAGVSGPDVTPVCQAILGVGGDFSMEQVDGSAANKLAALLTFASELVGRPEETADFLDICISNGTAIDSKRRIDAAWTEIRNTGA